MAFDMSFFHLAHARTNEDDSEASQKENESLSLQEILTEDPEPTSPSFNRPSQSFTRGGSSRQTPYSSRQHSRAPSGSVATSFASDDSPRSPGSLTARQRVNSFRERLRLDRFFKRSRKKEQRATRDKSARPKRPEVLEKEDTHKLTKFWDLVDRDGPEPSLPTSPQQIYHNSPHASGTSTPPRPLIHLPHLRNLPSITEHPSSPAASYKSTETMDSSRLAPESVDGEKKQKAIQDAKDMYQVVVRNCERTGSTIPPYDFIELIGKGGNARVYKCRARSNGDLVAIKIMSIDEPDFQADPQERERTIKDFQAEVSILHQLKDKNAKNINIIHDAFDLSEQLWIISDYCTGGSVRTLMRAHTPGQPGLEEEYIIPVARELALAIKSVHDLNVIHRDIKCSNVYITEEGGIQLGDFGIVGVMDDDGSKRRTIIGTPHYMPREMAVHMTTAAQETDAPYGTEFDVWSFGCSVYEMATGGPPNARKGAEMLGTLLSAEAPRLEGGNYSQELRDFVAFCLNNNPQERPSAGDILKHPYIANTQRKYPSTSLVNLIRRYKVWEYGGGWRQSLFMAGGAAPVSLGQDLAPANDDEDPGDWNFSVSDSFNEDFGKRYSHVVANGGDLHIDTALGTGLPPIVTQGLTPLQQALQEDSANRGERSLDRLWNPDSAPYELHTPLNGKDDNDLPLRNFTDLGPTRESMISIDLDSAGEAALPTFNFDFGDVPTMKAKSTRATSSREEDEDEEYHYEQSEDSEHDSKRATMEWKFPTAKRATMDWTFPSSSEPKKPAVPDVTMDLPPLGEKGEIPTGFRPTLNRTATQPIGAANDFLHTPQPTGPPTAPALRQSVASMIDLDDSLPAPYLEDPLEIPRPSTASSTTGSTMTDETSGNPFDLEEDESQNERDRNRFSYHKQWQSEGGQLKRSSRRSVPMHLRGNSLSSTESELDRPARNDGDVFNYDYNRLPSDTMRHQTNGTYPHDGVDIETWRNFGADSGFEEPRYPDALDEVIRQREIARQQPPRTNGNGHGISRSRQVSSNSMLGQDEVEFPQIAPPHPDALLEDADPEVVMAELDRLLGDFGDSLEATTRALRRHADVQDVGGLTDSDSSILESSEPVTGDEGGL